MEILLLNDSSVLVFSKFNDFVTLQDFILNTGGVEKL